MKIGAVKAMLYITGYRSFYSYSHIYFPNWVKFSVCACVRKRASIKLLNFYDFGENRAGEGLTRAN
jgi:hypothetical protein